MHCLHDDRSLSAPGPPLPRVAGENPWRLVPLSWSVTLGWWLFGALAIWRCLLAPPPELAEAPVIVTAAVGLGLPICGIGWLIMSIALTRAALDYRPSLLVLESGSPRPEDTLRGVIEWIHASHDPIPVAVELRCIHEWTHVDLQGYYFNASVLWSDHYDCYAEASPTAPDLHCIPIRFPLPAQAFNSQYGGSRSTYWRLTIRAGVGERIFEDTFVLPAHAAAPSPAVPNRDFHLLAPDDAHLIQSWIHATATPDGVHVVFPRAMHPRTGVWRLAWCACAAWCAVVFMTHGALLATLVALVIAVVAAVGTIRAWCRSVELHVAGGALTVETHCCGHSTRRTFTATARDAVHVRVVAGIASPPMCGLEFVQGRKSVLISPLFENRNDADRLCALLQEHLILVPIQGTVVHAPHPTFTPPGDPTSRPHAVRRLRYSARLR